MHNHEKPFNCSICDYICSNKAMLDKHERLVHHRERPFSCHMCNRRFGQKVHLDVHVSGVHLKERPYGNEDDDPCLACNFASLIRPVWRMRDALIRDKFGNYENLNGYAD